MKILNDEFALIKIDVNEHYYINKKGDVYSTYTNKILRLKTDGDGYQEVTFKLNGIRKTYRVHRLVAMTFLENERNLPYINHINGIKPDNRVENLEWCTASHNNFHRFTINKIVHSDEDLFQVENCINGEINFYSWAKLNKFVSHTFIRCLKDNNIKSCHSFFIRNNDMSISVYHNGKEIKKFETTHLAAKEYGVKVNTISYYINRKPTRTQKFSLENKITYLGKKSAEAIETTL